MTDTILINKLPTPTWNRLKVNNAEVEWDENRTFLFKNENIIVSGNEGRPINISVSDADCDAEYSRKNVTVRAEKGSHVTIYEDCTAYKAFDARLKIIAGDGSAIKIIQLLNPADSDSLLIHKTEVFVEKGSTTDIITVMLGRGNVYCDNLAELSGDNSGLNTDIAYIGKESQIIDYNITVNHYGKSTNSVIGAAGSLNGSASKTFRGTIDFKKGSENSKGSESETVLMLSDDVHNKTVPLILCAEENVEGNHGATIGRLDEETLFYFESRGICATEAENIMARAAVEKLIKMFGNDKLKSKALGLLGVKSDCGEE